MDDQIERPEEAVKHSVSNRNFRILGVIAGFSGVFTIFSLFELQVLIGFTIFFSSLAGILYLKWKSLRQKGIDILMQDWSI